MSENTTERKEVSFTIDGTSYQAYQGETVLEAALRNGYFIPHYCWHPSLTIAGNCRMCLVHTKPGPPKPQIACNTVVSPDMEVDGSSEATKTAREGILEFLLANHPLDCPICDQAGECDLQQYSFDHGRTTSKFAEIKTQRPRHDLGPRIRFNGNRCIVCTRCVRFCDEVTGTGELAVVNRSDSSWIDVFPGIPLDNPLSGCTADLCPVGALLDTDWIHTTRTWLLRGTKSVCSGCATGCNVNVEAFDDSVKRITPRENQPVNKWWMCDEGRETHKEASVASRLRVSRKDGEPVTHQEAIEAAIKLYRGVSPSKIAYLTTGHATLEELFLLDTIADGPGGVNYRPEGEAFETLDGFKLSSDKNPNRAGVAVVSGELDSGEAVAKGIKSGQIELVVVCDSQPGGAEWSEDLVEALRGDVKAIVISLEDTWLAQSKQVAFPGLHAIEKDGSYVNQNERVQRVRAAVSPPGDTRGELEVLQELGRSGGLFPRVLSAGGVFRRLAAAHPHRFEGLSYRGLGQVGLPLAGAADQTPAEECMTYYTAGPVSRDPSRAKDEQTRVAVHRESPLGYGTMRGNV